MKVKIGSAAGWMALGAISEKNIKNKNFVLNTNTVSEMYMWSCNGYTWDHGKSSTSCGKSFSDGQTITTVISGKKLKFSNSNGESFEVQMESAKYKLGILLYYTNSWVELVK